MNNIMQYKGYIGSIEFSEKDLLFYGKVQGVQALILYEGKDATSLVSDFRNSVDNYIELCEVQGIEPEKAYKGTFNVRISPDLHKEAAIYAFNHNTSLNNVVETAIKNFL